MKYSITDVLSDPSIESKIELIITLIERAKNKQSNKEFGLEMKRFLIDKEKETSNPYQHIGQKYSLGCLTASFLYSIVYINDFKSQSLSLEDLLQQVKCFKPSLNPLLKKTTTDKLINILIDLKFSINFKKSNFPLKIYFIPFSHEEVNAYYYPSENSIGLFKAKMDFGTPEYIFMHEMGHLVAHRITGDPDKVPESFIELNKEVSSGYEGDIREIFADLFSLGVMLDTEYASLNPFVEAFSSEHLGLIKDYFHRLVRN